MSAALKLDQKRLHKEALIDTAFDAFMDHAVARLCAAGLNDVHALEVLFLTADSLTERGALPPFPDDRASRTDKGAWLVGAADLDFVAFIIEVLEESDG